MSLQLFVRPGVIRSGDGRLQRMHLPARALAELQDSLIGPDSADAQLGDGGRDVGLLRHLVVAFASMLPVT